ncbi:MAG: hypothetical protein F6J93_01205 [Oscillatoria sp. SIO1A7]|nr:hypothetical protein [Oscillatoria sp. SIO1A7]
MNPKAKRSPYKQPRKTKAKASSGHRKNRLSKSNANADSSKLALQAATVAHAVKTIAQQYYQLEQTPQNPTDISHHFISGSALTFMHVCLLFAIHYLIEHFKARPGLGKKHPEAYRELQHFSRQERELSAQLKNSAGKR